MALNVASGHGPLILAPSDPATRDAASRVALITCQLFPDLWDDDLPLRDGLRDRGVDAQAVCWDDPTADWSRFTLAVLRSPWDYVARHDEFVAWARRVPRLLNPAHVVAWNTDKRYLAALAAAGAPVVPTVYVAPGESWPAPESVVSGGSWPVQSSGEWVVKPTISAGGQDTGRYRLPAQQALAEAHLARLSAAGRTAMIQPYLTSVDTAGETAIVFFGGVDGALRFSHAVRKGPILAGPDDGTIKPGSESIDPRTPSAAELAVAARTLAAIPAELGPLLYARVDLIPAVTGEPQLIELELTEPSLFLRTAPGAADRLADAIIARL